MPAPAGREADHEPGGMVIVGGPNEIADRIVDLHEHLGHGRQILRMDVGGIPHLTFRQGLELLGVEAHRDSLESPHAGSPARS